MTARTFYETNTGDTAWVLASAALVLLMTPGLAFFYGGMVRAKNMLAMLMQNFICIGIVSVHLGRSSGSAWAFGRQRAVPRRPALRRPAAHERRSARRSGHGADHPDRWCFVAFQLTFAIITPALITGATADRWKFGAVRRLRHASGRSSSTPRSRTGCSTPTAGWLVQARAPRTSPVAPSCTSTPVRPAWRWRSCSASARAGRKDPMRPHNMPFVLLGAGLLWFGWFGFNAGSALGANGLAGMALVNTNTATAAAMLGWLLVEKIRDGKPTTLGAASGAVAGLVAITPAAASSARSGRSSSASSPVPSAALAVGLKFKFGFDDSLDVVGVHLVGGVARHPADRPARARRRSTRPASTACSTAAA